MSWATNKERNAWLKQIRERDGSLTCHWCGASPRKSIDHVVSRSNGGPDQLWNFRRLVRGVQRQPKQPRRPEPLRVLRSSSRSILAAICRNALILRPERENR